MPTDGIGNDCTCEVMHDDRQSGMQTAVQFAFFGIIGIGDVGKMIGHKGLLGICEYSGLEGIKLDESYAF